MVSYSKFLHKGKILMLALDHRGSFSKLINPKSPDSVEPDLVVKIKGEIINSVYKDFSGKIKCRSTECKVRNADFEILEKEDEN